MGSTAVYGLPYPELSDPPDGPKLGRDLAEAVEDVLQSDLTLGGSLTLGANLTVPGTVSVGGSPLVTTKGYATEVLNNTTQRLSTGTEVICLTATITAVSAARYKITWMGNGGSTVAGDIARIRLRYLAGATLTTAGTQIRIESWKTGVASPSDQFCLIATLTGISGQYTIGGTLQRVSGTGSFNINGSVNDDEYLLIERVA